MKLTGLVLRTFYFEDYLSFLTEVLELELKKLSEDEMLLDLEQTWMQIKKVSNPDAQECIKVEFTFSPDEFEAIRHKISFFYYRKQESRFALLDTSNDLCRLLDPDGRVWLLAKDENTHLYLTPVRNC
jgi:hypothetical protein